ncbi:MAG: cyclic-di-AMP receptor [Anaerolineae bacterium]|nr:cyclic-di-AMP receptor [Anaerolineae bacterium]
MKMVMAVISRDEADGVLDALVTAGFTATFTESRGGMLRQAQYTLFIATKKRDVDQVLGIIRQNCHTHIRVEASTGESEAFPLPLSHNVSRKEQLGSAVVFVWPLERAEVY